MSARRKSARYLLVVLALAVLSMGTLGALCARVVGTPAPPKEKIEEAVSPTPSPTTRSRIGQTPTEAPPLRQLRREKGTLILPHSDPPTLDPALATDETSATYIVEIFSGLVTIDRNLNIVPDIAERWEISEDGTVYTFYLRDDVLFHNGKKVTTQDFKYSIERCADPSTLSPVAETYLGDIVGLKERLRGEAEEVKGVKVIDARTLQITIEAPKVYFLAKLTYPTAFVVDQKNVEAGGETWTDRPNGTGPFKLEKYAFGEELVLVPNDRYYGGPPTVRKVRFLLTGGSMMTMYENGELDSTPVSIIDIDRVSDPQNPLSKELVVTPSFSTSYLGFNIYQPPFDDVKVRQAFCMAIDTELIADRVFLGMAEPAIDGVVPPGMPGYDKDISSLPYDPQRARELIAESKYGSAENLPEVTLYMSGGGGVVVSPIAALVEMLKENLGVEVSIQLVEDTIFLTEISRRPNIYQLYALGWIADYPDPQNFLEIKFHGQSRDNQTGYSNPQVDALLDEASQERDTAKRMELYRQAEEVIVQDAAWAPLWYGTNHYLIKPYVKNLLCPPIVIPKLKYVSLEES